MLPSIHYSHLPHSVCFHARSPRLRASLRIPQIERWPLTSSRSISLLLFPSPSAPPPPASHPQPIRSKSYILLFPLSQSKHREQPTGSWVQIVSGDKGEGSIWKVMSHKKKKKIHRGRHDTHTHTISITLMCVCVCGVRWECTTRSKGKVKEWGGGSVLQLSHSICPCLLRLCPCQPCSSVVTSVGSMWYDTAS